MLLAINAAVVGVPLYLLRRDIRQTIDRFGVFETALTVDAETLYADAASELFDENPDAAVFCYGHTRRPSVQALKDGLAVNTGTWLKRLHRRDGIIGVLPPVFYPSYQFCAVRIAPDDDGLAVDYEQIEKPTPSPEELTLTERLLTLGRTPDVDLPDGGTVDEDGTVTVSE